MGLRRSPRTEADRDGRGCAKPTSSWAEGSFARRRTGPPNWGPHALCTTTGPLWAWLGERHLIRRCGAPRWVGCASRCDARLEGPHRAVHAAFSRPAAARVRSRIDPVRFTSGRAQRYGERGRDRAGQNAARGRDVLPTIPAHCPAAFVVERLRRRVRGTSRAARFRFGGWSSLVDRLEARMRDLGCARARTGVDRRSARRPAVIVALAPAAARRLLSDDTVAWPGPAPRFARRGDAAPPACRPRTSCPILDQAGWAERFSRRDRSLAPTGHSRPRHRSRAAAGE